MIRGVSYDFALLSDVEPEEVLEGLDYLRNQAADGLQLDLSVAFNVFGPKDFA